MSTCQEGFEFHPSFIDIEIVGIEMGHAGTQLGPQHKADMYTFQVLGE